MRTIFYIVPFITDLPLAAILQIEKEFLTAQEVMDHCSPVKIAVAEYHYVLDENMAEQINSKQMIFIYSRVKQSGLMSVPVGRTRAHGPVVVCGKVNGPAGTKYRGFSNEAHAIAILQLVIGTSMPDYQIDGPTKSLEEMLKEFGNKE